ncbi:MAG: glycoside hydrolase family 16 protein [Aeromicrobium erythreum]
MNRTIRMTGRLWQLLAAAVVLALLATATSMTPASAATKRSTAAKVAGAFAQVKETALEAAKPKPAPTDACGAGLRKADGSSWRCTFVDDFTGTALNRKVWTPVTTEASGVSHGGDCQVDDPDNIAVSNGSLKLTVRKEAQPFTCKSPQGSFTADVTSTSLSSLTSFAQTYGRFEMRAKMPQTNGAGTHSAWWLWPKDYTYGGWPYSGEIDIAEYYSAYPDRMIPQLHYVPQDDDGVAARSNYQCMIKDPTSYHTYTLEWTKSRIKIMYDGATCVDYTVKTAVSSLGQVLSSGAPFDKPFTLALTQTLGMSNTPNARTASTALPSTMEVDYVKVWS